MTRITITIETDGELKTPDGMTVEGLQSDLDESLYRRFVEDWGIPLEELTVDVDSA